MATRAKRRRADEVDAVWFAPEQLQADRIERAVADGASAQEVAELAKQPAQGEYREFLGTEDDGSPKLGKRLRWVHPDGEDEGYFEVHEGKDYKPVVYGAEAEELR